MSCKCKLGDITFRSLATQQNYAEIAKLLQLLLATSFDFNRVSTELYSQLLAHRCVHISLLKRFREDEVVKKIYEQLLKNGCTPNQDLVRALIASILHDNDDAQYVHTHRQT